MTLHVNSLQMINMKCEVLFSKNKNDNKKKCEWCGIVRVNFCFYGVFSLLLDLCNMSCNLSLMTPDHPEITSPLTYIGMTATPTQL